MASFTSFEAYARELDKMGRDLEKETRGRISKEMAAKAQAIAERAASADLGGDPKFSGWAPRLDTKIRQTATGQLLTPTRSGAGPWTVAEFGRNAGGGAGGFQGPGVNLRTGRTSRRKDGSVRAVRSRKAKRWNGVTRGKGTASDAVGQMERELPKIADRAVVKVMRKHFDVT